MNILQLCCFTNLWSPAHFVNSIDIKSGQNVFDIRIKDLKKYDLIACAPPCTQFTKANYHNWKEYPTRDMRLLKHIFKLCLSSHKLWFIENPPGRIEKLFPALIPFRTLTFRTIESNKEYVIYSNFIIMDYIKQRYGKQTIPNNKIEREKWSQSLITAIENSINIKKS